MKITPLEIRQKTFEKKSFGGYDKDEVQAYLISLSQAWERLLDENREMRIRLETADREVQKLREVESSLFKTLKTAEDTGANLIDQASKTAALNVREAQIKAESLIKDAKWQAKNIIEDAERQANDIERDCKSMENERDNFLSELRDLANNLLQKTERSSHKNTRKGVVPSKRTNLNSFKAQMNEDELLPHEEEERIPKYELKSIINEPVEAVSVPKVIVVAPIEPITTPTVVEPLVPEKNKTNEAAKSKNNSNGGSFFDQIG